MDIEVSDQRRKIHGCRMIKLKVSGSQKNAAGMSKPFFQSAYAYFRQLFAK